MYYLDDMYIYIMYIHILMYCIVLDTISMSSITHDVSNLLTKPFTTVDRPR